MEKFLLVQHLLTYLILQIYSYPIHKLYFMKYIMYDLIQLIKYQLFIQILNEFLFLFIQYPFNYHHYNHIHINDLLLKNKIIMIQHKFDQHFPIIKQESIDFLYPMIILIILIHCNPNQRLILINLKLLYVHLHKLLK